MESVLSGFRSTRDRAQDELDRMAETFGSLPPTPTPGGGPSQIPREDETELHPGTSGRREPVKILDGLIDLIKKLLKNWKLVVVGLVVYLVYREYRIIKGRRVVVEVRRPVGRVREA